MGFNSGFKGLSTTACVWLGIRVSKIILLFFYSSPNRNEVKNVWRYTSTPHYVPLWGRQWKLYIFTFFSLLLFTVPVLFKYFLQASCFYQNKISSVGSAANVAPRSPRATVNFTCSFTSKYFPDYNLALSSIVFLLIREFFLASRGSRHTGLLVLPDVTSFHTPLLFFNFIWSAIGIHCIPQANVLARVQPVDFLTRWDPLQRGGLLLLITGQLAIFVSVSVGYCPLILFVIGVGLDETVVWLGACWLTSIRSIMCWLLQWSTRTRLRAGAWLLWRQLTRADFPNARDFMKIIPKFCVKWMMEITKMSDHTVGLCAVRRTWDRQRTERQWG